MPVDASHFRAATALSGRRCRVGGGDGDSSADWVAQKRRAGFGWGAIARMLGQAEADVRRAYDREPR